MATDVVYAAHRMYCGGQCLTVNAGVRVMAGGRGAEGKGRGRPGGRDGNGRPARKRRGMMDGGDGLG